MCFFGVFAREVSQKLIFNWFCCGFVVVGNVRFSFGGDVDFRDLGNSSTFFVLFLKCGKNNLFLLPPKWVLLLWDFLRAISVVVHRGLRPFVAPESDFSLWPGGFFNPVIKCDLKRCPLCLASICVQAVGEI